VVRRRANGILSVMARVRILIAALASLGAAAPDLAAGNSRQLVWHETDVWYPLNVPGGAKPSSAAVLSAIANGVDVNERVTAQVAKSAIKLSIASALGPGTYDVHVRLAGDGFDARVLNLQLVVPAARLVAAPPKLVFDQIDGEIVTGLLNLRETSRLSGATLRAVQPAGPALSEQREMPAFLRAAGTLPLSARAPLRTSP
jgi:hypothetical protein